MTSLQKICENIVYDEIDVGDEFEVFVTATEEKSDEYCGKYKVKGKISELIEIKTETLNESRYYTVKNFIKGSGLGWFWKLKR